MKNWISLLAPPLGILMLVTGCQRSSPELTKYLESIRTSGMSEGAQTSIRAVAALRTKQTLLTFEKDAESGFYSREYRSGACPIKGATPQQLDAWRKKLVAGTQPEVNRLRALADLDQSGFVTTEEGERFRSTYELGMEVSYICQHEPCTLKSVSQALGVSPSALSDSLKTYRDLCERAAKLHLPGFVSVHLQGQGERR